MSGRPEDHPDLSDMSMSWRVDVACDAFEEEWIAGKQPRIEDFLRETIEPERSALFKELLCCPLPEIAQLFKSLSTPRQF